MRVTPFLSSFILHLLVIAVIGGASFMVPVREKNIPITVSIDTPSSDLRQNGPIAPAPSMKNEGNTGESLKTSQRLAPAPSGEISSASLNLQNSVALDYLQTLRTRISTHQNYPLLARKKRLEGTVLLEMRLDEEGNLLTVKPVFLQNHQENQSILIESALSSLREANPFPRPPAGISRIFQIPIEFHLDGEKK